jgi:glycosyltransferase involved in cell wall biosynthesis
MRISIVCPVFNEEKYIGTLLKFYQSILPTEKELLIVDGDSADRTQEIVEQVMHNDSSIKLLLNPRRYVSYALNLAIPQCSGDVIVRWDAHTTYSADYLTKIIEVFSDTGADIVGGPTRTAFSGPFQEAVGHAISTRFGMGNSSVHQEDYFGETDSVTFGAWKKEIFKVTGLFDERLKRNQDDEFHYRARSMGFSVYQHPDIKLYYHPRSNLRLLFRQYYEYGLYKPLVLAKVRSGAKLRHFVPSLFVVYVLAAPIGLWVVPYYGVGVGLYFLGTVINSVFNRLSWRARLVCSLVYPVIHLSYGFGCIMGIGLLLRKE